MSEFDFEERVRVNRSTFGEEKWFVQFVNCGSMNPFLNGPDGMLKWFDSPKAAEVAGQEFLAAAIRQEPRS